MRYLGSKLKLLSFIDESIMRIVNDNKPINEMIFTDLFSGSGVVSEYFFKKGYNIISNDMQYYSYVLSRCLLSNTNGFDLSQLSKYLNIVNLDIKSLFEYLNNIPTQKGFIYNNYSSDEFNGCERKYFTIDNAKKIDAIRIKIQEWYDKKIIDENLYFYLLGSLINSTDKRANTAGNYGAYLKKLESCSLKPMVIEPYTNIQNYKINNKNFSKCYQEDANILIKKIRGDILYLDPPYNRLQYSSFYHILDTIALYDNPIIKGKTGQRCDKEKSKYSQKRECLNTFIDLINNANFKYIFVSYSNEGIIPFETMQNILKEKGKYNCFEIPHQRYKSTNISNTNTKNKVTEYLHCVIVS